MSDTIQVSTSVAPPLVQSQYETVTSGASPAVSHSLRHGFVWSAISVGGLMLAQLLSTATLSRLLDPTAFGLMALATALLRFVTYFAQLGTSAAIVQKSEVTVIDERACFTVSLAVGTAFCLLTIAVSPLTTYAFPGKDVSLIVALLSLTFVIDGSASTSLGLLRRQLRFHDIALIELTAFLIGNLGTTVVLALRGFGVMSLVGGTLAGSGLTAILSYVRQPHSVRPLFGREVTGHFLSFGTSYSVNTFLDFLHANAELFLIGRMFPGSVVGLYNRAFMLASLPIEKVVGAMTRVIFPAFARTPDRQSLHHTYRRMLETVATLTMAACFGMAIAAPELVGLVLGNKWSAAVTPLRLIALATPFVFIPHVQDVLLDSLGALNVRRRARIWGITMKAVALTCAIPYGFHAVLVAACLAQVAQWLITNLIVDRILEARFSGLLAVGRSTALALGPVVAIAFVHIACGSRLPSVLLVLVEIVTGALALGLVMRRQVMTALTGREYAS